MSERKAVGDMKAGLTSGARPKLSILCRAGLIYEARAQEYGADKYARGNHHGAPPAELGEGKVAGALRLLGYIDATQRHLTRVADAINRALGTGGDLVEACSTRDLDAAGNFPASGLPDLAHAKTSLGIGISCAIDDGLLPADPGQPWTAGREQGLPQKDDPAAERARVAALCEMPTEELCGDECRDCATRATFGTLEDAFDFPLPKWGETHQEALARAAAEVAAEFSPFDHKWFDELGREYRTDDEPQILGEKP